MSELNFYDVEKIFEENKKKKKKKESKGKVKKIKPMSMVLKDYEDFYSRLIKVSVIHVAGLDLTEYYKVKENKKKKVREKVSLTVEDLKDSRIYSSRFVSTENRCTILTMCNAAIYIADNIHNVMNNIKAIGIVLNEDKKYKKYSKVEILKYIYEIVMDTLDSGMVGKHPNKIKNRDQMLKILLLTTLIGDDSKEVEIRHRAMKLNIKRLKKIFKAYDTPDDFMNKISKIDIVRSMVYIGLGISPEEKIPKKVLTVLEENISDDGKAKTSLLKNIKRSIFRSIDVPDRDVLYAVGKLLIKDWENNGRPVEVDCLLRSSYGFISTNVDVNESKEVNVAFKLYAAIVNIFSVK